MTTVRLGDGTLVHDANSVVTVGTFDGVHCGHRGIIERMHEASAPSQSRIVVVTFDPHPQIVLQKLDRKPVRLLTTLEERLNVLESLGVDMVVVIPFTKEFAATPPQEFVRMILVDGIGLHTAFVGHDHMFGKDRAGDEDLLRQLGNDFGFDVVPVPPLECNGIVVSSTKIREALYHHQLDEANQMLGRLYTVTGTVVHGDGRGRTLGIQTANIVPSNANKLMPGNGVYAVTTIIDDREYEGVANIGVRPTFTNDAVPQLEVHVFESNADMYDKTITVSFHRFLRTEQRFDSKESLVAQLHHDIQQAHTFFLTPLVRTIS